MSSKIEKKQLSVPLTPWELPKLLEPMHRWRRRKRRKGSIKWRPHFLPILAFVYRNRFAVASQIQRRFADALTSDRTARRHLAELEVTGCFGVADTRSTSALFPKVYFVTGRGARKLEESLRERDKPGKCCRRDRSRPEAYSADHVLHEVLTTEFLLNVWQTVEHRADVELLTMQRRALEHHRGLVVDGYGQQSRLKPDAMFLFRQSGGLMCCFVEVDNGTMSPRQLRAKFALYDRWATSATGRGFLLQLYTNYGVRQPQVSFRVLVICRHRMLGGDHRRLNRLLAVADGASAGLRDRLWFTTVSELYEQIASRGSLDGSRWWRCELPLEKRTGRHLLFH